MRSAFSQDATPVGVVEFEPRVGSVGTRVVVKSPIPKGAELRFGGRPLPMARENDGTHSFLIPPGSTSSFLEVALSGKVLAKSAVPVVVSGSSLVSTPKLIGLKEAIDVFGYSDPNPEAGRKQEPQGRPLLVLDEAGILTIGEPPLQRLGPAVELGDYSSAASRGMGPAGLLITARPPKKKLPTPTPVPN